MGFVERFANWLPDNPVMRAELAHLLQGQAREPGWRRGIRRLALTVGLGMAVGLFTAALLGSLLQINLNEHASQPGIRPLLIVLVAFTLLVHFRLMLSTLSLAAKSIAHEKQSQAWDTLVLTNLDARQIVRGKWAAVVRRQLPAYLVLCVLRIGAIIGYALMTNRISTSNFLLLLSHPHVYLSYPLNLILLAAILTLLTLANLSFTAASGIWASAATNRAAWALASALVTRLVVLFAVPMMVLIIIGLPAADPEINYGPVINLLVNLRVALFDNGVILGKALVILSEDSVPPETNTGLVVAVTLVALGIYALWTGVALWRAQTLAVKHLATPPESAD